jgi:four helix bundle protein
MAQVIKKAYDLEERTSLFAEEVIIFCKLIPHTIITTPLISQVVRSSTSIGANYFEANGASSRKDFKNKIFICKKESKETMYWLDLLSKIVNVSCQEKCKLLLIEAHELTMIFSKIASNTS